MEWRRFAIFNFLGATLWVTVISCAGYFFGRQFAGTLKETEFAILIIVVMAGLYLLWKNRARTRVRKRKSSLAGKK